MKFEITYKELVIIFFIVLVLFCVTLGVNYYQDHKSDDITMPVKIIKEQVIINDTIVIEKEVQGIKDVTCIGQPGAKMMSCYKDDILL